MPGSPGGRSGPADVTSSPPGWDVDRDTLCVMTGLPPTPANRPAQDRLVGRMLDGKVRLERLLGKGGTGRVYEGTQVSLGRRVAVKVMRPDLDAEDERSFEDRFFREASLAGQLQHPNIVTVHDYGRTADGVCYIVMELLGGSDLKALMTHGPIPPSRTLVIFEQIVRGLRAAHRAGLVHRDVKPGNIRLTEGEDGRDFVKVLDFGLVKGSEDTEITQDGTFLGTPHYAAPEQVKGDEADGRSDLYAVGVMMYRALCGKLPYWSKNPMAIAMAHVREPYPPMASRAPDVVIDPGLEAIARRCMHKAPDRRYPDAGALLADVVAARRLMLPDLETGEIDLPDDLSLPPVASPERRRRWPLAFALGLGLAGALGAGAVLQGHGGGGDPAITRAPPASETAAEVLASPAPAPPRPARDLHRAEQCPLRCRGHAGRRNAGDYPLRGAAHLRPGGRGPDAGLPGSPPWSRGGTAHVGRWGRQGRGERRPEGPQAESRSHHRCGAQWSLESGGTRGRPRRCSGARG